MPRSRDRITTKNLAGRVVVITGAASGIGRELALLCARRELRAKLWPGLTDHG